MVHNSNSNSNSVLNFVNQIPTNNLLPSAEATENIKNILKQIEHKGFFDQEKISEDCIQNKMSKFPGRIIEHNKTQNLKSSEIKIDSNEIQHPEDPNIVANKSECFNKLSPQINIFSHDNQKKKKNDKIMNIYPHKDSKTNYKNRNNINTKSRCFNNKKQFYKNREKSNEITYQNTKESNNNSDKTAVNKPQISPGYRWI